MEKSIQKKTTFIIAGIGILYFLFLVRGILLPFILSIFIAYLFHNLNNKLERVLKSRNFSTIVIILIFYTLIILSFVFIIPIFSNQLVNLFDDLQLFVKNKDSIIYDSLSRVMEFLKIKDSSSIKLYILEHNTEFASYFLSFFNNIISKSISAISFISILIITPITSFYFLKEWNNIVQTIDNYVPQNFSEKFNKVFNEIDKTLSGCLKGQLIVCFILGILYGTSLFAIGLKYGFLIGFLTGLANFIPYFGMIIGCTIAFATVLYQFGFNLIYLCLVAGVFIIGQIFESNVLTPNLVGSKVNLHPMWIIFAIFCGGSLFGFWGLLFAIPVAGILGVLVRFYLNNKNIIKNDFK